MSAGFGASSGIKQGCPASGSLFAIALDPFLRLLCLRLPGPVSIVSAFADDMGIVTRDLLRGLEIIAELTALLRAATAMRLNPSKSIVIPLGHQTAASILKHIKDRIPSLGGVLVQWHGRYLGFMVGPTADTARWETAGAKYWQRGMAARDAGGGVFHNVLHYSIYATSVAFSHSVTSVSRRNRRASPKTTAPRCSEQPSPPRPSQQRRLSWTFGLPTRRP